MTEGKDSDMSSDIVHLSRWRIRLLTMGIGLSKNSQSIKLIIVINIEG